MNDPYCCLCFSSSCYILDNFCHKRITKLLKPFHRKFSIRKTLADQVQLLDRLERISIPLPLYVFWKK